VEWLLRLVAGVTPATTVGRYQRYESLCFEDAC